MKFLPFIKYIFFCLPVLAAINAKANIYHITNEVEWMQAVQKGYLTYPSLQVEGFIHCASLDQVLFAANKHHMGKRGTILLLISPARLKSPIRYDYVQKYDQYFPHIYGMINADAVVKIFRLPVGNDGLYRLPPELGFRP